MINITVSESGGSEENLSYLYSSVSELLCHAGCSARIVKTGGRVLFSVNCPINYSDIINTEIADKVAEIIVIKYKYEYFKRALTISGLKSIEKEILFASLIAADLEEDKKYVFDKVKCCKNVAIDGVYNFRLKLLKKKWTEVIECIPNCFLCEQLKEFITYLVENKRKRVYVDQGKVYDSHYRRLKRSNLLDGERVRIVREILLSNCGEIELNGSIPKEDEFYLKEYFCDKIFITGGGN